MWISADPMLEKYLPDVKNNSNLIAGGVYSPINIGLYSYAHLKPVKLSDPDGNAAYKIPLIDSYFIVEKGSDGNIYVGMKSRSDILERNPNLTKVKPDVQEKVIRVVARLEVRRYKPEVKQTLRTIQQQRNLLNRKDKPTKTIKSYHRNQAGQGAGAADVVDKRWGWNDKIPECDQYFKDQIQIVGEEGLESGGTWKTLYDPAHMQTTDPWLPEDAKPNDASTNSGGASENNNWLANWFE